MELHDVLEILVQELQFDSLMFHEFKESHLVSVMKNYILFYFFLNQVAFEALIDIFMYILLH